ncbi:MAG TPA: SdrD B-like domain-containing protein, partial [Kofleriaceae bacterium]
SICDNPDTCTGAGECVVNHEPVTLLCREDGGECDVPEYCDAAGECPANGFEASGTACGDPSDTICDNPDACTGTGECVVNHEPVTVLCREDAGECDVPEYCDAAGACPANGFEVFGTACGSPTDTACDNPDTCDATGDCLSNYESAGTLCRPLAGECDVAESCDAAGSCAPDAFQAAGTVCRASVDACDPSEECTGTAAGCPTDVAATCTVCGWKFYDANVNGLFDPDEDGVDGWEFLLTKDGDGLQTATSGSTGNFEFSSVSEGDFTLCENYSVGSWHQTTPVANGGCFTVHVPSDEAQSCEFDFGNVCLGAGGGHTIGFWSNRNGQIAFNLGSSSLARLVGLNLVNANGTAFDPSSYTAYKNWLNKATATNMAYMLSAQLSAMALNVQKGYVDPDALVYAPGTTTANALGYTTIDALLVEANTELGLHPLTLYGSAYRSYQEALKNALNNANTNTAFVQPGACSISFALVTRFAAAFRLALGTAIDTATVTDAFDVGADDLTIAP